MPNRLNAWLPVILWMVVIFLFSAQAYSGAVTEQYFGDYNIPVRKLAHVMEFAVLCALTKRACLLSGDAWHRPSSIIAFVVTVLYAASDEWHQSFVPGRSSKPDDVLVDSVGAIFALIAWAVAVRTQLGPLLRSVCSRTRN